MANEENTHRFSAFHGKPLLPDKGPYISKLASLGVFDIEQFVGLATVASLRTLLAE